MLDQTLSRRSFLSALGALALIPAGLSLAACSNGTADTSASSDDAGSATTDTDTTQGSASGGVGGSVLVAYYSAQGHTAAVAEAIADALGADIFTITPTEPYTDDDLNYSNDESRVSQEHLDENRHVELTQVTPDGFDGYDAVFVGYPIWWGEAAWVVDDFVSGNDFSGKTVIPFCTSASSPMGDSGTNLAAMAGTGDWQEGMRFRSSVATADVADWAQSLSF